MLEGNHFSTLSNINSKKRSNSVAVAYWQIYISNSKFNKSVHHCNVSIIWIDGAVGVLLGMPHGTQVHGMAQTTLVGMSPAVVTLCISSLLGTEHVHDFICIQENFFKLWYCNTVVWLTSMLCNVLITQPCVTAVFHGVLFASTEITLTEMETCRLDWLLYDH